MSGKRRYQLQSLPPSTQKNDELWSTIYRAYAANVHPPKMNFLEGHISAPYGVLPSQIVYTL